MKASFYIHTLRRAPACGAARPAVLAAVLAALALPVPAMAGSGGLATHGSDAPRDGPGWSEQMRSPSGFRARHPAGF